MLSKDPQFRKIKIKSRGVGGGATYWLGPDHLLIVTQDGYHERYRRIYYRDIQALVIRRTSTWLWITVVLIGMLILMGMLPLTIGDVFGLWFGGINLGIWTTFLIFHLVGGPSCGCRLVTAVQNRDLPHLNRWKRASRLVDELQAEVNRVQRSPAAATTPPAPENAAPASSPATP